MKSFWFCSGRQTRSETTNILRMATKKAEERFIENGGVFLEKLIGSWTGKCSPIRNFSAKELQQATNNYDSANVLHDDSYYTWYKGSIQGRIVSIKKFNDLLPGGVSECDMAINDIVTAAQMTAHNNILELIGCFLETYIPMAVYEFAENGTFSSHSHISGETPPPHPLLWKSRLRIATDIASAVAYLHISSRRPIIHRDIKPSNVFLDQHNVAKLSGFDLSIAIPEGETHVEEDYLTGTLGYMAPEYLQTRLASEKIDVYSFGVLLMVLLTGGEARVDGSDLMTYFRTHKLSNQDNQVLDPTILEEVGRTDVQLQVQAVSELALRCTETDEEERPTMLEVAKQLLQLKKTIVDH